MLAVWVLYCCCWGFFWGEGFCCFVFFFICLFVSFIFPHRDFKLYGFLFLTLSVHDDRYSKNASFVLNKIYTFLLINICIYLGSVCVRSNGQC